VTRYYIDISPELVNSDLFPDGFRLIQRWGPRGTFTERWIAEDDDAPAYYEDRLVDVNFSHTPPGGRAVISNRTCTTNPL
jgi:hypothetical protein